MWKIGPGGKLLLVVVGLLLLVYTVDHHYLDGRLLHRIRLVRESPVVFTAGDFPAGAAAPASDVARVPTRPLHLVALPRGSAASLLVAAGGTGPRKDAPVTRAFGIGLDLALLPDERAMVDALTLGGDRPGGADAAILGVDRLVQVREALPDAKLKAVLLVSRSRGHEAIAAASGIGQLSALKGRKLAVAKRSSARFLLLWELAQVPLPPSAVDLVLVNASADAARLFKESQVDAAAGTAADLVGPARERGGSLLATSADAPQLLANVLVVRSDLLARYPDAVRRLIKALLDSAEAISRDPTEGARLLATLAPQLGDPFEAIKADPPALLAESLAFFEVRGDTPVRYDELFLSASALWRKLGERADTSLPAVSRELGPLLSVGTPSPKASVTPSPP